MSKISGNPIVHILVAAFIGAVLPVLVPALQGNDVTSSTLKIALYAGVAAVLRSVVLLVPTTTTPPRP